MDWLDPQVPVEWLADFLRVIAETPNLDWLLLTKRPELWQARLEAVGRTTSTGKGYAVAASWLNGAAPANVWFGVTCEDQTRANERLPILLCIPAKIRWVSAEPLLGPIKFRDDVLCQDPDCGRGVDWIVVGGESGSKRRDCGVEAIVDVAGQCQAAGVACFVKQDCAQRPGQQGRIPAHIWALKEEAAR
jgi:protein gp37